MAKTLYDKLWDAHLITEMEGEGLLYIDRHLTHEVTSPQAFDGLRHHGRRVRRPDKTIATMDHSISTRSLDLNACGPQNALQLSTLVKNCNDNGIVLFPVGDARQGIVHVMGPEQGLIWPGMTVVCGDSHTATHGALGTLAFGIGTSDVEHVLATQTLRQRKAKNLRVNLHGELPVGVSAKDIILAVIGRLTSAGATGYVIEYAGDTLSQLSMSARMTICNMSIEAGAKAGMMAPDDTTFAYLRDRPYAPKEENWVQAMAYWQQFFTDEGARFDKTLTLNVAALSPQVTWGTNPGQVMPIDGCVPDPAMFKDIGQQTSAKRALEYVQLRPGTAAQDIPISHVFIGSCTNSRLEDLREAAQIAAKGKVAANVNAIVVPGSMAVKQAAEKEGLHDIFLSAGFEWRLPGCSMCLGMNDDSLSPGDRCASTSNRNFEGRQGRGSFTHLVSPATAAATALAGHLCDVREV